MIHATCIPLLLSGMHHGLAVAKVPALPSNHTCLSHTGIDLFIDHLSDKTAQEYKSARNQRRYHQQVVIMIFRAFYRKIADPRIIEDSFHYNRSTGHMRDGNRHDVDNRRGHIAKAMLPNNFTPRQPLGLGQKDIVSAYLIEQFIPDHVRVIP